MVNTQIKRRGITDQQILDAMLKVERHRFVPEKMIPYAYEDHPLPIGNDQTISQPYIVAIMTYLLKPKKSDVVLEIGTGSGYQAAVLAELVKEVYTIEIVEPLGKRASK
ncbi:MAG: protein-L-isoaspartate O-methyltransferase family protein, partial [Candidatus Hinthialibacter sp.]